MKNPAAPTARTLAAGPCSGAVPCPPQARRGTLKGVRPITSPGPGALPSPGADRASGMFTETMADFSPVELLELFQRAQNQFTDRVDAVAPDQWEDESLPGWTVADLVAHLVSEALWVPPLLAGEPVAEGRFPDSTTDLLGS